MTMVVVAAAAATEASAAVNEINTSTLNTLQNAQCSCLKRISSCISIYPIFFCFFSKKMNTKLIHTIATTNFRTRLTQSTYVQLFSFDVKCAEYTWHIRFQFRFCAQFLDDKKNDSKSDFSLALFHALQLTSKLKQCCCCCFFRFLFVSSHWWPRKLHCIICNQCEKRREIIRFLSLVDVSEVRVCARVFSFEND